MLSDFLILLCFSLISASLILFIIFLECFLSSSIISLLVIPDTTMTVWGEAYLFNKSLVCFCLLFSIIIIVLDFVTKPEKTLGGICLSLNKGSCWGRPYIGFDNMFVSVFPTLPYHSWSSTTIDISFKFPDDAKTILVPSLQLIKSSAAIKINFFINASG